MLKIENFNEFKELVRKALLEMNREVCEKTDNEAFKEAEYRRNFFELFPKNGNDYKIIKLTCEGRTAKGIAQELGFTSGVIENYKARIKEKIKKTNPAIDYSKMRTADIFRKFYNDNEACFFD